MNKETIARPVEKNKRRKDGSNASRTKNVSHFLPTICYSGSCNTHRDPKGHFVHASPWPVCVNFEIGNWKLDSKSGIEEVVLAFGIGIWIWKVELELGFEIGFEKWHNSHSVLSKHVPRLFWHFQCSPRPLAPVS
jgi:hypothetical protein